MTRLAHADDESARMQRLLSTHDARERSLLDNMITQRHAHEEATAGVLCVHI
jgi:hypothetical protein